MSADLESLGFAASADENGAAGDQTEVPFITSSANISTDAVSASNTANSASQTQKRTAAEISEDEDSQSSKGKKVRRVTRTSSKPAPVPVSPQPVTRRPLAPKPASKKSTAASKKISDADRLIDTSTAHVKALTGAKGAAMCFEIVSGTDRDTTVAIPNLASADLTPEEKAKFSRDRNRLHARNTRIRKKAYVVCLLH